MQIALLTDTHFGARGDDQAFDRFFEKFYIDTFFPTLEKKGINQIIHLGDVFDRRKYINYITLQNCKRYFFDETKKRNIKVYGIVGNHDVYFKNTNNVKNESKKELSEKRDWIEENILTENKTRSVLVRVMRELGYKWFELPHRESVVCDVMERYLKSKLKKMILGTDDE